MSFNLRNAPTYSVIIVPQDIRLRNAPTYAIVKEQPVVTVRKVTALALEAVPPEVRVRSVSALAMFGVVSSTLFSSLNGLETLRAAIKKELGVVVTDALATFGDPTIDTGAYNTKVILTANPNSDFGGNVSIVYSRFPLSEAFKGKDTSQVVGSARSIHGRLAAINAFYGLQLEPRDVVDRTLVPDVAGFTLKVAPTSYLYIPGSTILIGQVSNGSDLAVEIEVDQMDGFEVTKRLEDWIQVTAMKGFEPAT